MTIDVLAELLGEHNLHLIRNVMPLAISNAFYEQIYLHYGLERLSYGDGVPSTWRCTHTRGDILEAYMAAIQKDVSRNGQGYQEVRDWLLKVMALRLRLVALNGDGSSQVYSTGTVHQSLTVIPTLSSPRLSGGATNDELVAVEPLAVILSAPATNPQVIKTSTPGEIWSHAKQRARSQVSTEGTSSVILPWTPRMHCSSTASQLYFFRQFIFENMAHIFTQCGPASTSSKARITLFWRTLKSTIDNVQHMILEESQMILLLYYRVCFI